MPNFRVVALFLFAAGLALLGLISVTPAVRAGDLAVAHPLKYTSLEACGVTLSWWRELRFKRSCSNAADRKHNIKVCQMLCGAQASITPFGGGPGGPGACVGSDCPPVTCVGSSCEPPPPCVGSNCNANGDHGNHYGNDKPDNNPVDVNNRFDTSPNIHPAGGKPEDAGKPS